MADAREMTLGLQFDFGEAVEQLDHVVDQVDVIRAGLFGAEDNAKEFGSAIVEAGSKCADAGTRAADGLNGMADSAEKSADDVRTSFKQMGSEAEEAGTKCTEAMGSAAKGADTFSRKLKAGFQGLFKVLGEGSKRVKNFFSKIKSGFSSIGTAIKHPIQSIKKMVGAFGDAEDGLDDLGTAAKKAEGDLEKVGKAGSEAGSKIKDAFKGAIKTMLGIEAVKAGIGAVTSFVGSALEAVGAVESVGKKFDVVFGSASKDAEAWADSFSGTVHRSENEVKGFLTSSAAMFKDLGLSAEDATDLSKITTSLGYDIGAKFSIDDSEAMVAVQDAISGNNEALSEFGIQLDEATLKQKALAMGFGDDLSKLDDTSLALVRFNSILDQTGDIEQGAITDNNGLVNSTKGLKAIYSDFMADAGTKFTPVIEQLFTSISSAWPTVEPMLMGFVDVLANGFQQAVPILMDLGTTLIPVLSSVLGTLFEAIGPLLPVIGELVRTVLPPLAEIFGSLGGTLIPPIVDILGTLNNSVIKPLIPVIQKLVEAILPPLASLLEAISPILEALSPLLKIIGDVVGIIAEGLGKVIGWLAGGVSKVAGFFGDLFGGAKNSEREINNLGTAMDDIGAKTVEPAIATPTIPQPVVPTPEIPPAQIPTPQYPSLEPIKPEVERPVPLEPITQLVRMEAPEAFHAPVIEPETVSIEPPEVPASVMRVETGEIPTIAPKPITVPMSVEVPEIQTPEVDPVQLEVELPAMPDIVPPEVEPIALEIDQPDTPKIGAADTVGYTKSVSAADAGIRKDVDQTWTQAHETAKTSLQEIGTAAENTHNAIASNAESMWGRIVSAAQAGARAVVNYFKEISEAAAGISEIDIRVSGGAELPHNAKGTDSFEGGWTHINEEGGEVAFLPKGTAILPEDKSAQLVQSISQNTTRDVKNSSQINVNVPSVSVTVMGNADETTVEQLKQQLGTWIQDTIKKAVESIIEENAAELINQNALA